MRCKYAVLGGLAFLLSVSAVETARSAEYGEGPWLEGYTDILGGYLPSQPGFYTRIDVYSYNGNADATVFNGAVQLDVSNEYTTTIAALSYVTPWKILGGTWAVAFSPTVMAIDVDVGLTVPRFTGPLGARRGGFSVEQGQTNLAFGDSVFTPLMLSWNQGYFDWSFGLFGLAPTGDYSVTQLANTSLNIWAVMPRFAATYFNPKTGWQATGAAIYSVSFENDATDYKNGDIVNVEGSITKNFGPLGVGVVGYGMIQVTGDSGAGALLGSFESRKYALGPILTYTTSPDPTKALTVLAKYYKEFDAVDTFEGETFDVAVSFKF